MIYQKYNIKKTIKDMSRQQRGSKSVKDIMSGIKGPVTYRGLKKTLAEEGISKVARKRILKEVKTGAMPQQPAPPQKPMQEKIAKEGWKVGGKLGEPKAPQEAKTPAGKAAQWMKETGRMGIKFEKERKAPSLAGQKFQSSIVQETRPSVISRPTPTISKRTEKVEPKTREEVVKTAKEHREEHAKIHQENIGITQKLDQQEQTEEARIDELLKGGSTATETDTVDTGNSKF